MWRHLFQAIGEGPQRSAKPHIESPEPEASLTVTFTRSEQYGESQRNIWDQSVFIIHFPRFRLIPRNLHYCSRGNLHFSTLFALVCSALIGWFMPHATIFPGSAGRLN
jgi:hypothetical protein